MTNHKQLFYEFKSVVCVLARVLIMVVPPFWQEKYKREAGKNWDKFYKRNQNKFFKDRHWLQREFPDLAALSESQTLLEVGCGVGNLVFPVFAATGCRVVAADFANTAIYILQQDERFDKDKMNAKVHDFTQVPLDDVQVDIATMIFVLSAVPPEKHVSFLQNVRRSSPVILFRDYAVEDAAQKRFSEDNKLSDVLFVRQDGTLAYYFDIDYMRSIAGQAGYELTSAQYVASETVNVKEGLCVARRFLQCKLTAMKRDT